MSTLQIGLAPLVVVILLLAWWWVRKRDTQVHAEPEDRIDTLVGWPPQTTRVLGTSERLIFSRLVQALPDHMILAQVPLARFLSVPKRNSYADWLRRVGYQCVDFVVCDLAAQVIAVVEIQGPQSSERSRKRMTRISRTLKAAQIPMQIWSEGALPSLAAARELLLPRPAPKPAESPTGAKPAKPPQANADSAQVLPGAMQNPFDDSRRDASDDEIIELLEPPPSTWFDELDSTPVPLASKR